MSFFNEFLLGSQDNVVQYVNLRNQEHVQCYEFAGITDLDIGILFAIVSQEEFKFSRHELLPLEDVCPVETLFPLPDAFIAHLRNLSDEDKLEVAQEWAATEELNCPTETVLPIVNHLCQFAHQKTEDKGLFFRITV